MEDKINDIKAIREIMEKSTKFLSLSGLSGIVAGSAAIIGAGFAYWYLFNTTSSPGYYDRISYMINDPEKLKDILILLLDAIIVLIVAIGGGIFFSWRKAKKQNRPLFGIATKQILRNMSIPLITGGLFALIFLFRGNMSIVACSTLIFYGLALVSASRHTFTEVQYLGYTEIILGLLAAIFLYKGLFFWTLGFGVCHILYGSIMYIKYDLKRQ